MSLLLPSKSDSRFQVKRNPTRKEVHGLKPRWRFVLELHMAGHMPTRRQFRSKLNPLTGEYEEVLHRESIEELTGYSPATIHKILTSEEVVAFKQEMMRYYDEEFQALYPMVVDAIRRGLESGDKYLDAAKTYLKEFGRETSSGQTQINLTAEDIVFNILNQRDDDSEREASITSRFKRGK